jgi:hypothetical protein
MSRFSLLLTLCTLAVCQYVQTIGMLRYNDDGCGPSPLFTINSRGEFATSTNLCGRIQVKKPFHFESLFSVGDAMCGYVDAAGINARFEAISRLLYDINDNLLVCEFISDGQYRLRKVTPAGTVSTFVSSLTGCPYEFDSNNRLYYMPTNNSTIYSIGDDGQTSLFLANSGGEYLKIQRAANRLYLKSIADSTYKVYNIATKSFIESLPAVVRGEIRGIETNGDFSKEDYYYTNYTVFYKYSAQKKAAEYIGISTDFYMAEPSTLYNGMYNGVPLRYSRIGSGPIVPSRFSDDM